MKNLRKLSAADVLACVFSLSAFAGETSTPPCAPEPGQASTPPCAAALGGMGTPTVTSTDPGQLETPPAPESRTSLTEIAADVLMSILPLF